MGTPPESATKGTTAGKRKGFACLISGAPVTYDYIRAEGQAGRIDERLMAIVAEGDRERVFLPPLDVHEELARRVRSDWKPEVALEGKCRVNVSLYGIDTFADLFTDRQLLALTTFSDLVGEARERIRVDAAAAGLPDDGVPLREGGVGAIALAEAVSVYLAFALDRMAMTGNNLVRWNSSGQKAQHCFGRQALPMIWDFAEPNFLASSTGSMEAAVFYSYDPLRWMEPLNHGLAYQMNAVAYSQARERIISADPPYYDNVGYADLSDFFYVWVRRTLRGVFPDLFATLAVPKVEELIAAPHRHEGSKKDAEAFFLNCMTRAMLNLATQTNSSLPLTIYYAFKQSENKIDGAVSTGWETFLDALLRTGFSISGTWPIRTEMRTRQVGMGSNALASSIVLACRPLKDSTPMATRREFVDTLKSELPSALRTMQAGNIAPVDLAQASIGPGMAVFSRYAGVVDVSGGPLSVRDALTLINQTLEETLAEQEGDFDADTRWAVAWFEQAGFVEGEFGIAETLSKAKNTSVDGMIEAGILRAGGGKVRLLRPEELPADWDPQTDRRRTVWEVVHHLVRVHGREGEEEAALLLAKMPADAERARELAYRLYRICEQKNRSQAALGYNALVQSWPEIARLARERPPEEQMTLLGGGGGA